MNGKRFSLAVFLALFILSGVVMAGSLEIVNNTKDFWISLTAVQTSGARDGMLDEFVDGSKIKSLGPGEHTKATWPKEEHPVGSTTLYVDMVKDMHGFWAYKVDFSSPDKMSFVIDEKKYEYQVKSNGNDYTLVVQPVSGSTN